MLRSPFLGLKASLYQPGRPKGRPRLGRVLLRSPRPNSPPLKGLAHPPPLGGWDNNKKYDCVVLCAVGGAAPVNPCPPSPGGGGVFFIVLLWGWFFFGCLMVFFCSLRRGGAFVARLGGVLRFSVCGRLLPLWLSLCFLLRRVGWIVALRFSSLSYSSIKYAYTSILFADVQIIS